MKREKEERKAKVRKKKIAVYLGDFS